ncbi:MAG: ATP-dependent DNA helicase RecG, partial [Clostridia bacterium]|nr:ATP-dependent DNA helicase RecG [Clostridia bacterium]
MSEPALSQIKGVGPARLRAFHAAGVDTVRDLLAILPREYRDLSDIRPLASLSAGDEAAVRVRVAGGAAVHRAGKLVVTKARVADDSDAMSAVWYNQPWLRETLVPGREFLLYGKVEARFGELQLVCPAFESGEGLKPVYKPLPGIPQKTLTQTIAAALALRDGQWEEPLPESLRRRWSLCERNYAILNAHRPVNRDALVAARRRLAFEELLLYQVGLWLMRGAKREGVAIDAPDALGDEYWQTLPFAPTNAQRRVLSEVLSDLRAPFPMARLIQGDVGCGKTAIAFGAMYAAVKRGWQCALMAPTEILAAQHYETARKLLEPLGVTCGLLTGSLTPKNRRLAHEAVASGAWRVVIGTHALITESVQYENLGLVITDEQHRFGVRQRTLLSGKGDSPNVLVMSATPIPRTLSLILYGDLDISIVDELPPGRTPVKTNIVPEAKRQAMYGFLREEVKKGRQIYVVCPLIEESEAMDAAPAEVIYENLRTRDLPDLRVALVHGRLKPADKDAILSDFHAGKIDVLVSTTVIEVGVNVPNASVMVIENAERFGLAQLHQLRGRVGRGAAVSYCFLMAEPNERLRLMTKTNDGFEIARKDMELRGPGEILGQRQSGVMALGAGALMSDTALLKETHDAARELLTAPDSDVARAVIELAQRTLGERLKDV